MSSFHLQKNSEICTYSYPDTILSVKLSRQVTMYYACVFECPYVSECVCMFKPIANHIAFHINHKWLYAGVYAFIIHYNYALHTHVLVHTHTHVQRLVVVLRQNLYLHNIRDMKVSPYTTSLHIHVHVCI